MRSWRHQEYKNTLQLVYADVYHLRIFLHVDSELNELNETNLGIFASSILFPLNLQTNIQSSTCGTTLNCA